MSKRYVLCGVDPAKGKDFSVITMMDKQGKMTRWIPKVSKTRIVDPHGGKLGEEVNRLQGEGYHKLDIQQDRLDKSWHVEAVRFEEVKT
jgi:hypothetical protein